jgi:hypothetical protein
MKLARTLVALLPFALTLVPPALATPRQRRVERRIERRGDGWEVLGEKTADRTLDHDTVVVTRREGRFTRIRIDVADAPLNLREVKVIYAGGGTDVLPVRRRIPAGGSTRALDLRGVTRVIETIELWYDTPDRADSKAHVTVLGFGP